MKKRNERKTEKPHTPHTLGAPSSLDEPVEGVQPSRTPCPTCGKTFDTKSEMERHRKTAHEALEGHSY